MAGLGQFVGPIPTAIASKVYVAQGKEETMQRRDDRQAIEMCGGASIDTFFECGTAMQACCATDEKGRY